MNFVLFDMEIVVPLYFYEDIPDEIGTNEHNTFGRSGGEDIIKEKEKSSTGQEGREIIKTSWGSKDKVKKEYICCAGRRRSREGKKRMRLIQQQPYHEHQSQPSSIPCKHPLIVWKPLKPLQWQFMHHHQHGRGMFKLFPKAVETTKFPALCGWSQWTMQHKFPKRMNLRLSKTLKKNGHMNWVWQYINCCVLRIGPKLKELSKGSCRGRLMRLIQPP